MSALRFKKISFGGLYLLWLLFLTGGFIGYGQGNDDYDCVADFEGDLSSSFLICDGYKTAFDLAIAPFTSFHIKKLSFEVITDGSPPTDFTIEAFNHYPNGEMGQNAGFNQTYDSEDFDAEYLGTHPTDENFSVYKIEILLNWQSLINLGNLSISDRYFWISISSECTSGSTTYLATYYREPLAYDYGTRQYSPSTQQWTETQDQEGIITFYGTCYWVDVFEFENPEMEVELVDASGNLLECVPEDEDYYVQVYIWYSSWNASYLLEDDTGQSIQYALEYETYLFGPYSPESSHTFTATGNEYPGLGVSRSFNYDEDYEICDIVGIEAAIFRDFKYYPVPMNDFLQLKSETPVQSVEIFTLNGQLIYQNQPNSTVFEIQTNAMASGVYLMKIEIGGASKVFKLIKN